MSLACYKLQQIVLYIAHIYQIIFLYSFPYEFTSSVVTQRLPITAPLPIVIRPNMVAFEYTVTLSSNMGWYSFIVGSSLGRSSRENFTEVTPALIQCDVIYVDDCGISLPLSRFRWFHDLYWNILLSQHPDEYLSLSQMGKLTDNSRYERYLHLYSSWAILWFEMALQWQDSRISLLQVAAGSPSKGCTRITVASTLHFGKAPWRTSAYLSAVWQQEVPLYPFLHILHFRKHLPVSAASDIAQLSPVSNSKMKSECLVLFTVWFP